MQRSMWLVQEHTRTHDWMTYEDIECNLGPCGDWVGGMQDDDQLDEANTELERHG
jgi:hypothetical protein